jgi:hypothetical protein
MAEAAKLYETVEFAENPEPRCPCVLLLDTSSSMRGTPIAALQAGLQTSLLLDSRVLRDQELNERRKQRFASLADVVHELKEPQVEREFLL